ncbi:MAG: hypothetical protein C5B54_12175 [Acidobacteria bacterium]|nr:MAG: hypothetical protein C5B54_12175 [Acidobacteriota bacterium]
MKKYFVLILSLCLLGTVWWNRHAVLFLLYTHWYRRPPQNVQFSELNSNRIHVYFVPSPYLTSHVKSIALNVEQNLTSAEKEFDTQLPSDLKLYLFNNWEEKGSQIRDVTLATADPDQNAIYCVVNEQKDGTRERPEYRLLLRSKWGKPAQVEWLEITAAALADRWNQRTLSDWANFLLSRDLPPHFPALFTAAESQSGFIVYPWNALFAKFVKEKYGWNALKTLYQTTTPPPGYQSSWQDFLKSLKTDSLSEYKSASEFQKGMSYAYWNSYDGGYPTEKSAQSLNELRHIGVNWIAAIPYGFMRSHDMAYIHFAGHSVFGESDESMLAVTEQAHSIGMKVMMKPQIWVAHDSWPGRIEFDNEAGWNEWFENYEAWIIHYALLSEMIHVDQLCIGTELVETTLQKPERWRELISKVRKIYHGPIVYAANWGKEFEGIKFWDQLDYIGLDNYYPVRRDASDNIDQMRSMFNKQRDMIRNVSAQFGKPVLFTEIGYHATDGAGMGTHEDDFTSYNERLQADCYRLAMETYWNEPWFYGMYWWKWFSDPTDAGKDADLHSPHGRMAERVIQEWYSKARSN